MLFQSQAKGDSCSSVFDCELVSEVHLVLFRKSLPFAPFQVRSRGVLEVNLIITAFGFFALYVHTFRHENTSFLDNHRLAIQSPETRHLPPHGQSAPVNEDSISDSHLIIDHLICPPTQRPVYHLFIFVFQIFVFFPNVKYL